MDRLNVNDSQVQTKLLDTLLAGKTPEEQVVILKNCFDHALTHPWGDDELRASVIENICNEYKVPHTNNDGEDVDPS